VLALAAPQPASLWISSARRDCLLAVGLESRITVFALAMIFPSKLRPHQEGRKLLMFSTSHPSYVTESRIDHFAQLGSLVPIWTSKVFPSTRKMETQIILSSSSVATRLEVPFTTTTSDEKQQILYGQGLILT